MSNKELGNALSSNYLLVSHSINKWSGQRVDRKATDAVISGAHATGNAGKFVKNALAGADKELKEASSAYDAIRTYIYSHTLPYSNATSGALKGDRLLPTVRSMEFIAEVDKLVAIADARRDDFAKVYPQRVQQAISNLAGLASADDYPDVSAVTGAFGFNVIYEPVPSVEDFSRLSVPAELADQFAESVREKQEIVMHNALSDLRKRLLLELERVAKALAKRYETADSDGKKAPIGKNLISNVKTLVGILNDVTFAENPQLQKLSQAINNHLCVHTVEQLKANPSLAGQVSKKATRIVEAVNNMEWY